MEGIVLVNKKEQKGFALVVAAHPDDEILGCGATAAALASSGWEVQACILSGQADARRNRPDLPELKRDTMQAQNILGMKAPILGSFPNIKFNTVPHLDLVQFIEGSIASTGAGVLFTHHPGDLNNDHTQTSRACQAAARLFQRSPGIKPLRALYFMEILSSTDWAFNSAGNPFRPDTFVAVGPYLEKKIEALRSYKGIIRDFPHPRSEEILRGLAALRGGQAGIEYAEAFQTAFRACRSAGEFM